MKDNYTLKLQDIALTFNDLHNIILMIKYLPHQCNLKAVGLQLKQSASVMGSDENNLRDISDAIIDNFYITLIKLNKVYSLKIDNVCDEVLKAITNSAQLEKLNLNEAPIDEENINYIYDLLSQKLNLKQLIWDTRNFVALTFDDYLALAELLSKFKYLNQAVLRSFVNGEDIPEDEKQAVEEVVNLILTNLLNNSAVERLDISRWDLTVNNMTCLSNLLANNKTLLELKLRDCSLSNVAVEVLGGGLQNNTCLRLLDISENPFDKDGLEKFFDKLMNNPASGLCMLNISGIGVEVAKANYVEVLANYLSSPECLCEKLYLRGVQPYVLAIDDFLTVCKALTKNLSIKYISFAGNNLAAVNYKDISEIFLKIRKDIVFDFTNTGLAQDLLSALKTIQGEDMTIKNSKKQKKSKKYNGAKDYKKSIDTPVNIDSTEVNNHMHSVSNNSLELPNTRTISVLEQREVIKTAVAAVPVAIVKDNNAGWVTVENSRSKNKPKANKPTGFFQGTKKVAAAAKNIPNVSTRSFSRLPLWTNNPNILEEDDDTEIFALQLNNQVWPKM